MTNEAYLLQVIASALRSAGAAVHFERALKPDPDLWKELTVTQWNEDAAALAQIAAALRRDTSDFACIDEIIEILDFLDHTTVPRHDFG